MNLNDQKNNLQNNTVIDDKTKENDTINQVQEDNLVANQSQQTNTSNEKDLGDKTIEAVENFLNTEDHAKKFSEEEVKKNKTNAILCYIPLVVFYFIFTNKYKESKYLHFHANQGLNVTIVWILSTMISNLLVSLFTRESYILNNTPPIISFISYALYCTSFLLMLFGIINTVNDSSKELPIISKIKLLK